MSIPPLVCSTPPPPDQCDDDKEHDDFDIHYNLSQEEDDRSEYDFCSFNNFNTASNINTSESSILNDNATIAAISHEGLSNYQHETEIKVQNNDKLDEDNNIEDLDLQLEQISIAATKDATDESQSDKKEYDKDSVITDTNPDTSQNITVESSPTLSSGLDVDFVEITNEPEERREKLDQTEVLPAEPNNLNDAIDDFSTHDQQNEIVIEVNEKEPHSESKSDFSESGIVTDNIKSVEGKIEATDENKELNNYNLTNIPIAKSNLTLEDDIFDDFQFSDSKISTENNNKSMSLQKDFDSPWDNGESLNDFGEFHANFDDVKYDEPDTLKRNTQIEESLPHQEIGFTESDDMFGDFDDFKSSSTVNAEQSKSFDLSRSVNLDPMNNELLSYENINKIISHIFQEEIDLSHEKYEKTLESSLCETWGYLLETEIRQPYMVNWNNSLGQKTLLKALCIDSRNILFGPNWSHNMPRYAVNLGATPLQPQSTATTFASHSENLNNDKQISMSDTWTDSNNTNGQEFTYAEALLLDLEHLMATLDQMANNHSSLKISDLLSHACNNDGIGKPAESRLDDFPTANKSDKEYPKTLNIQPIRQISLPDTHIFTPTDSEVPRSKTIHYNNGPPILVPQISTDIKEKLDGSDSKQLTTNLDHDNEYSEFQDFKGINIDKIVAPSICDVNIEAGSKISVPNVSHQILQPVKVEPSMPILNWPDPGQVKETFDDFSEFVSSSSWFDNKKDIQLNEEPNKESSINKFPPNQIRDINDKKIDTFHAENEIDDEFDTFKSADPPPELPKQSKFSVNDLTNKSNLNSIPNHFTRPMSNVESQNYFQNVGGISSDTLGNYSQSKTNIMPSVPKQWSNETNNSTMSNISNNSKQLLQPIPAATPQSLVSSVHTSGQILQPLSLESISQINWPNPGIDLQDLSRFNPVDKVRSLQADASTSNHSKGASPVHNNVNQVLDDDGWGDFVSSKPKQHNSPQRKPVITDDDEWSDFVSSPSVRPQNGVNTISFNVHTNINVQKSQSKIKKEIKQVDIPTLNYVTPKGSNFRVHGRQHFQNL